MALFTLIAAVIGGALNRLRGGLFADLARQVHDATGWGVALWLSQQRTQTMRAIYAIPTGILAWYVLGAGPWWLAGLLIVSTFCGQAFFGNGGYLYDRGIRWPDWLGMSRNLVSFAPAAFVSLPFLGVMVALGAFHASLYWLAYRVGRDSRLGEIFVGATTYATLINL